jgi:hypothetical protein
MTWVCNACLAPMLGCGELYQQVLWGHSVLAHGDEMICLPFGSVSSNGGKGRIQLTGPKAPTEAGFPQAMAQITAEKFTKRPNRTIIPCLYILQLCCH